MPVKVLIVDDSGFFRRRLTEIVSENPELEVVGTADNGREAVEKTLALSPDVITMDYEMPVMDGVTAVRAIMAQKPTPILMFSSLTYEGARVTLDSMEAGAVDYLPKNFEEISRHSGQLKRKLWDSLLTVARSGRTAAKLRETSSPVPAPAAPVMPAGRRNFKLVVIGTSTGGPIALQKVVSALPANFHLPLVLVQHMPASFTAAFAERLNGLSQINVREARDGDLLRPGIALLAPGGKQLMISKGGRVKVLPGDERLNYKPCVDVTFASAANVFGADVLAVVLTGMGADGCEGARILKSKGAAVWAQDQETSVIYGMPMAVARAKLTDAVLPLPEIAAQLARLN